jgi:uncharacterized protein (DUF302 family)
MIFRAILLAFALVASAQADPLPGTITVRSGYGFDELLDRTERAVGHAGLLVIASPSASRAAQGRGIEIPGNAVILAFSNHYAVRLLQANVDAGIEAPLRLYITENKDKTATLSYRKPSAVFAPYKGADVATLAAELDGLFDEIAREATGG